MVIDNYFDIRNIYEKEADKFNSRPKARILRWLLAVILVFVLVYGLSFL